MSDDSYYEEWCDDIASWVTGYEADASSPDAG